MANDNINENPVGEYFASKEPEKVASVLLEKAKSFFNTLESNAYLEKINKMWKAYHGAYNSDVGYGHQINFTGEQGELVTLPVNHFRNIAQHMNNMITANRPIMEARAINTDYKSLAQTYLANGILDYYMRERHLEDALKRAVEMAIVLGSGFIKLEWNVTAGEAYDYDEEIGQFNYEGELEYSTLSPLDVVVDGTMESWNPDWCLTRTYKNRYNLMAKYPEVSEKIKSIQSKIGDSVHRLAIFSNDDTDDIPVFEFYHKRTEAIPEGRYVLFLDSDVILLDTHLPYRVLPIFRISPSDIIGTPYGYTPMFDVFPIQEAINSLYSTILTNQNAFGVQNIYVPRGADIQINSLEGAMNIIEGNAAPEPLNLTQTPAEVFRFLEELIRAAETISGINSVARGNPEASLRSGAALALVQSMALQFISGLQQSYVKLVENVGTALIQILKDFATTPKVIALVGRNNRPLLKEFVGEDINAINRVVVDVGNPLSRCLAKDTPVLMYDGTIKMVQEIKINDLVMGPDSGPRTVKNVNSGQEMMYEITSKDPHRNIKYGCNESHILTLRYCSDDFRYDIKQGDIIDITVKDYLNLSMRHRRLLQGFTTGVEFEKKSLEIPPYILGAWLGDGTSKNTCLTTMDKELSDIWINFANDIGMKVRIEDNRQPNKSKNYHITSGEAYGAPDRNPFINALRSMELINNKHIPFFYLTSSREDRLNLLAGLLDTDGHRIDETFIFTQKNERLVKDVVYLTKSLGFRVTVKKFKSNSSKLVGDLDSDCFKISIGGNTSNIPVKIPRKQCHEKIKARNPLNYGINVECKGFGTYYGFTLQEEPHFLLGDFTVTHNTVAGRVQMAEQLLQMKLLKSPQQYFQVINTGRLDMTFEGEMSELLLIKSENERLLEGEQVQAIALDNHTLHINEHKTVLADPDLRKDTTLVENTLAHIQEHIDLLKNTDPSLLQIIGQQPIQQPPQGQPSQGALEGSPMEGLMEAEAGLIPPGEEMTGGEAVQNVAVPQVPTPPEPFENLPVLAQQLGPT